MPSSIKYFEWSWFASLVVGFLIPAATHQIVEPGEWDYGFVIVQILTLVFMVSLILLTSRKRSKVAKWILILTFIAGIPLYASTLGDYVELGLPGLLAILQIILQAIGIFFLFAKESRTWIYY